MEQVTDVVFRQVVARAGAPDVWYTEFANATGWVHAGSKGIGGRLVKTDTEHPIVAQIWGGEPGDLEQFAKHCAGLRFDGIDINMGCPAKSAVKSGGAALIRQPDLAAAAIAAAKKAGLPVSVKTRLGYSSVSEWEGWLTHLLQQDVVALTIHLRTKKEMSKVPAHYELIPAIKALRDTIAPHTLLIINGDIKNRVHGEELVAQYGVDGVMIGRGIFSNPFAFAKGENHESQIMNHGVISQAKHRSGVPAADYLETELSEDLGTSVRPGLRTGGGRDGREGAGETRNITHTPGRKQELIQLLSYHLDMYDTYRAATNRPYDTLKRFFKIYIRDFDGASDIRDQLMHTKSTNQARAILSALEE